MSLDGLIPAHLAPAHQLLRVEGVALATSPPATLDLTIELEPHATDWDPAPLVARLKALAAGSALAPPALARTLYDAAAARHGVRGLGLSLRVQEGLEGAALAIVLASGSVRSHLPSCSDTKL